MSQPYHAISRTTALSLKLIMADIDGTLNGGGDDVIPGVIETVRALQAKGIILGLVSGRTVPMIKKMAAILDIDGPFIAENGAVAALSPSSPLLDLGYSRQKALEALAKLRSLYPGKITERRDNNERIIDLVFMAEGIPVEELRRQLPGVEVLDSSYIMHIMQKGISKGKTLTNLLPLIGDGKITPAEVFVAGDSSTDLTLFENFPNSLLVRNPRIPEDESLFLQQMAAFISDHEQGQGFAEAASQLLKLLESD